MSYQEADELSPAERRRLKVRGAILEAAEKVFSEEGEAGLSIRRLAEEVDYSPAAIYKYFGSKDELVSELKDAFFEEILVAMDELGPRPTDFTEWAIQGVLVYLRTALARPHHYVAAFSGTVEVMDTAEHMLTSHKGVAFSRLQEMVAEGVMCGVFRPDLDVTLAAKSVWASSHGLIMLLSHLPDFPSSIPVKSAVNTEKFCRYHAELIVSGLKK